MLNTSQLLDHILSLSLFYVDHHLWRCRVENSKFSISKDIERYLLNNSPLINQSFRIEGKWLSYIIKPFLIEGQEYYTIDKNKEIDRSILEVNLIPLLEKINLKYIIDKI